MLLEQPAELPLAHAQAPARASTPPSSSAPDAISAMARDTVLDVPCQAAMSGEVSGRQRKQGRNPASCAAAALGRKMTFSSPSAAGRGRRGGNRYRWCGRR